MLFMVNNPRQSAQSVSKELVFLRAGFDLIRDSGFQTIVINRCDKYIYREIKTFG